MNTASAPTNGRKIIIAVTGSFAGGKSTFCQELQEAGATVIDADQLAREESAPGSEGLEGLLKHFGDHILAPDGTLDRRKLGAIVFGDINARRAAETILHPLIRVRWLKRVDQFRNDDRAEGPCLLAYAVPLFFESGQNFPEIDRVVAVVAPPDLTIARATARDGLSRDEVQDRLNAQLPYDEKCRRADICVMNTGSIDDLRIKAQSIYADLIRT